MTQIRTNGISLEVETLGDSRNPAILLVMGLGMQLVAWPDALCQRLVDAGYYVVRFDNRDIGLSQRIEWHAPVRIGAALLRTLLHLPVASPYRLDDMADDSVGVLDALGIEAAHVVGASMGGMIAQVMAARQPQRCLSLTSIMSSSGSRWLPPPKPHVARFLLERLPADAGMEAVVERYVRLFRAIGSPGFPTPEQDLRDRILRGVRRSYDPYGGARQLLAIIASGDRSALLRRIQVPTLVIHGTEDPLAPPAGGRDTARKIPGARLQLIQGMGHDLAPGLLPLIGDAVLAHAAAAALRVRNAPPAPVAT